MTAPDLIVEQGQPTGEELAALVAVLTSLPKSTSDAVPPVSAWWRSGLPAAHRPAPGAWRESTAFGSKA